MAVNTFGVTPQTVRQRWFPHRDDFSASSPQTSAAVTVAINEHAAVLEGWLLKEAIAAADIDDTASAAYLQCARVLKMMVALELLQTSTGGDPELAKALEKAIAKWREALEEDGATFLGDDSLTTSASDPDGPTTHIDEYDLDTGDDADASDVIPVLRRSDEL